MRRHSDVCFQRRPYSLGIVVLTSWLAVVLAAAAETHTFSHALPYRLAFETPAGHLDVRLGLDSSIPELFIAVNLTSAANGPIGEAPHISFGCRTEFLGGFDSSLATMGPAEFTHLYSLGGDEARALCHVQSHLATAVSGTPTPGAHRSRPWRVRGASLRWFTRGDMDSNWNGSDSGAAMLHASFSLYPFFVPRKVRFVEALLAAGTSVPDHSVCKVPPKHDLFRARFAVPLDGRANFSRPFVVWGCRAGVPTFAAPSSSEPACSECNTNWAGPACDIPCDCGSSGGLCGANHTSLAAFCTSCDPGRFGELCDGTCTCVGEHTHGCDDGPNGTGACDCRDGFSGKRCEHCASDRFGLACTKKCTCAHGTCDNGSAGSGVCLSCNEGFAGPACNVTCPRECPLNTRCDNGLNGTGSCAEFLTPQRLPPPPPPPLLSAAITVVVFAMALDIRTFVEDQFASTIAGALGLLTHTVDILSVVPGSVVVRMQLRGLDHTTAQLAYSRLIALVEANDSSLTALRIVALTTNLGNETFDPHELTTSPDPSSSATAAPPSPTEAPSHSPPVGGAPAAAHANQGTVYIVVGVLLGVVVSAGAGASGVAYFRTRNKARDGSDAPAGAFDFGDDVAAMKRRPVEQGRAALHPRGPRYAFDGGADDVPGASEAHSLDSLGELQERERFRRELLGEDEEGGGNDHDFDDGTVEPRTAASSDDRAQAHAKKRAELRGHVIERPFAASSGSAKSSPHTTPRKTTAAATAATIEMEDGASALPEQTAAFATEAPPALPPEVRCLSLLEHQIERVNAENHGRSGAGRSSTASVRSSECAKSPLPTPRLATDAAPCDLPSVSTEHRPLTLVVTAAATNCPNVVAGGGGLHDASSAPAAAHGDGDASANAVAASYEAGQHVEAAEQVAEVQTRKERPRRRKEQLRRLESCSAAFNASPASAADATPQ